MTDIGDATNLLVQAQNVELLVASTAGAAGTLNDELVLMRDVSIEKDHPETRTNHGRTRTYSYSAPDISISFVCSGTTDLLAYLNTRSKLNARNVLPIYKWAMKVTSNNGQVRVMEIIGTLPYIRHHAPDSVPSEPITVEARIRSTSDDVTITTPSSASSE